MIIIHTQIDSNPSESESESADHRENFELESDTGKFPGIFRAFRDSGSEFLRHCVKLSKTTFNDSTQTHSVVKSF